jgi:hypothetical protein
MSDHPPSTEIAVGILKAVGVLLLLAVAAVAMYWGFVEFNKPVAWTPTRPTEYNRRGTVMHERLRKEADEKRAAKDPQAHMWLAELERQSGARQ